MIDKSKRDISRFLRIEKFLARSFVASIGLIIFFLVIAIVLNHQGMADSILYKLSGGFCIGFVILAFVLGFTFEYRSRNCPRCGQEMKKNSQGETIRFICPNCAFEFDTKMGDPMGGS